MEKTNRLQEAVKQIQLAQQELEDDKVSQDLEQALESLQDRVESLENEAGN